MQLTIMKQTENQDFKKSIVIDSDLIIANPFLEQTRYFSFMQFKKYSFLLAKFYKEHKRVPDLFEVQDILRIASNRMGYL